MPKVKAMAIPKNKEEGKQKFSHGVGKDFI